MTTIPARVLPFRGTAAALAAENAILADSERVRETDTGRWKTGDGSTHWNSLPYDFDQTTANGAYPQRANNLTDLADPVTGLSNLSRGALIILKGTADNGKTNNQPGFQAQLTALAAQGGGTAILPPATSYYGVASDLVLPQSVGIRGQATSKLKNPGSTIPTTGNVSGSVLGPAVNATFTFAVVQVAGNGSFLENLSIFGNGDHTITTDANGAAATATDAPRAIYLNSVGTRVRNCFGWGGVLTVVDGPATGSAQDTDLIDCTFVNNLNTAGTPLNGCTVSGGSATFTVPDANVPAGTLHKGQSIHVASADGDGLVPPWTYVTGVSSSGGVTTVTLNQALNSLAGAGITRNLLVGKTWVTGTGFTLTNNSTQLVFPDADTLTAVQNMPLGGIGASVNGKDSPSGGTTIASLTPTGSQVAVLATAASGTTVTQLFVDPATVTAPIPCERVVLNDGSGHTVNNINVLNTQPIATTSALLSTGAPITSIPVTALAAQTGIGAITLSYTDGGGVTHTQTFTTTVTSASGATGIAVTSQTPNYAFPSGTTVQTTGVLRNAGLITVASMTTAGVTYPIGSTIKTPDNTAQMNSACFASTATGQIDLQTGHTVRLLSNSADCMLRGVRCLSGTAVFGAADTQVTQSHFSAVSGTNGIATFNLIATAPKTVAFSSCILDGGQPTAAMIRRDSGSVLLGDSTILNGNSNTLKTQMYWAWDNGNDGRGFTFAGGVCPKNASDGFAAFIHFGSGATPSATKLVGLIFDDGALQGYKLYDGGVPGAEDSVTVIGAPAPTVAAQANLGTGATATVTGTDRRGVVNLTAGTASLSAGNIVILTFGTALSAAPTAVLLTPAGVGGANAKLYVTGLNANGFTVAVGSAAVASSNCTFYYRLLFS